MSAKVMKVVNPHTGLMQCKVCGCYHSPEFRAGGYFKRGSWQCLNGCKLEDLKSDQEEG